MEAVVAAGDTSREVMEENVLVSAELRGVPRRERQPEPAVKGGSPECRQPGAEEPR